MGSIVALTDAGKQIIQRYTYDTFGTPIVHNLDLVQPYLYTAREWDRELGLYYYRARYYDPMEGKFISKDPIGLSSGDFNQYNYAFNNPGLYVDPNGTVAVPIVVVEVIVIVGGGTWAAIPPEKKEEWGRDLAEAWNKANDNAKRAYEDAKEALDNLLFDDAEENDCPKEPTPLTDKDDFENVRNSSAKKNKKTGEIWERDRLHNDHYEVYKNKKKWEQGRRDRSVWEDGRLKDIF